MLIVHPEIVRLGALTIENVSSVIIERTATKLIVDWSDSGPHVVLADVPEQRVSVRIVHEPTLQEGTLSDGVRPGDLAQLSVIFATNSGHSLRRKLTAQAMVSDVKYQIQQRAGPGRDGTVRHLTCVLISPDGAVDPITITDAGAER